MVRSAAGLGIPMGSYIAIVTAIHGSWSANVSHLADTAQLKGMHLLALQLWKLLDILSEVH